MSKRDRLILTRTGEFAFIAIGDSHCGMVRDGQRQDCKYTVRVCCNPDTVDPDGYMFEQLVVQDYFDRIRRVKSTCELLAIRVASELEEVIMQENTLLEIYWIEVSLSAAPYAAAMTFRYHPR